MVGRKLDRRYRTVSPMQVESSVDLRKNALLLCAFPIIDRLADPGGTRGSTTYRWKGFSARSARASSPRTRRALLAQTGVRPGLATIIVGDDPASHLYVKNKQKACDAAGTYIDDHKLPASTTQSDLLALIEKKNADSKIHGILVQLPLPKHIDSKVILDAVSPHKDADGFHPYNFGRLVEGHPVFEACTPKGVIKMIESTGIPIEGKRAVVLGRSNIVVNRSH